MSRIRRLFDKHDDEFNKFERIVFKHSRRPDLHAFALLDRLFPGEGDMVTYASHETIYLAPDLTGAFLTEDVVIELARCGVRYDRNTDCLYMFV